MAKIRVHSDRHPGEVVMRGVDDAVRRVIDDQPDADRERSLGRQEAFVREMRRIGRSRRDRRRAR